MGMKSEAMDDDQFKDGPTLQHNCNCNLFKVGYAARLP